MKPKSYKVWLENKNGVRFPMWRYIESPLLKKWIKENCLSIGTSYILKGKEYGLANAPFDDNGYVVKIKEI